MADTVIYIETIINCKLDFYSDAYSTVYPDCSLNSMANQITEYEKCVTSCENMLFLQFEKN
jgi:hypothetical protein